MTGESPPGQGQEGIGGNLLYSRAWNENTQKLEILRILYLTISQIQVTSVWPHEKDGGGLDQLLFQLPRYPTPHTSTQTSWYWGQNYTFESIRMHWNLKSNSLRHPNRAVLYLNFIITFPFDFQRRCTTVQSTIFVTWGHDNKRLREDF